jgi:hypothetical protein
MKKKVLALVLILTMALTVGLVACQPETVTTGIGPYLINQTVREFAVTQNSSHSGLAFVTISTDAQGNISGRSLNEAFIPNEWAKLSVADANQLGAGITEFENVYTATGINTNVVALRTSGGSAAISLYPKYIELTVNGVAKIYEAKGVTITNNSAAEAGYKEATETAVALVTEPAETPAAWATLTNYYTGAIRYYETTAAGTASTATTSLENRLSTDKEFAEGYIAALKSYELTGTTDVATTAIKYFKGTDKIDTARKATRAAYSVAASTGAIAIGAAMKTQAGVELTGNALAYATTFFKRDSAYTSRMTYKAASDAEVLTSIPTTLWGWALEDAYMQTWLDANIANLTVEKAFAMAKGTGAEGFKNGAIITGASSYHTNIYIALYVKAYNAIAKK